MIRVAGIEDQYEAGIQDRTIDGHTPVEQLEIYLRELISNASDALSKARFNALTDQDMLDKETDLAVRLIDGHADIFCCLSPDRFLNSADHGGLHRLDQHLFIDTSFP